MRVSVTDYPEILTSLRLTRFARPTASLKAAQIEDLSQNDKNVVRPLFPRGSFRYQNCYLLAVAPGRGVRRNYVATRLVLSPRG